MNYAIVVFTGVMGASVLYYRFRARKWFHGPGKSMEADPQLEGVPSETTIEKKNMPDTNDHRDSASQASGSDNEAQKNEKYQVNEVERA
jgi:hypothetical protein